MDNTLPDGTKGSPEEAPHVPDREKSITFGEIFAFVATAAGLVSVVFAYKPLPGPAAKGFAVAGILLASLLAARAIRALQGREHRWRLAAELAAAMALIACVAVVAAAVAGRRPASSLPVLRFVTDKTPALCQPYYGTGTIPKGYDLLVFEKPADGDWYLEGLARNRPGGGWRSPSIHIDNPRMVISAALVSAAVGDYLLNKVLVFSEDVRDQGKIKARTIAWLSRTLPPSAEDIGSFTVRPPNGILGACP